MKTSACLYSICINKRAGPRQQVKDGKVDRFYIQMEIIQPRRNGFIQLNEDNVIDLIMKPITRLQISWLTILGLV